MKKRKIRSLVLAALTAVAGLWVTASPAYANCEPDETNGGQCQPCDGDKVNAASRKLIGHDLFACPM